MSQGFNPNWYSHTGNTLADLLEIKAVRFGDFCSETSNDSDYWSDLINGSSPLTESAAKDLSNYFKTSIEFWWNRENYSVVSKEKIEIAESKNWLKSLPLKDLKDRNWISQEGDIHQRCLDFFQTRSIENWNEKYEKVVSECYFRKSDLFVLNKASFATWYRRGEILCERIKTNKWNKQLLENSLDEIKALSQIKKPTEFIPKLVDLLAQCGVSLAIEFTPIKCPVSGFTKFISEDRVMMLLSFRFLSDDHFWFTIFHEIGHLILHEEKKVFTSPVKNNLVDDLEVEANLFAQEALLPSTLDSEILNLKYDKRSMVRFAIQNGISPGILVGQLQYRKRIAFSYLNGYKRRYNKEEIRDACFNVYGI